jgi:soluble lytic murein transglycosylase-like protein
LKRPLLVLALLAAAPAAQAEIALLTNGQTFKIDGRRTENGQVWLVLRGGGEVGVSVAELRGVVPDEIIDEVTAATEPSALQKLASEAALRHGLDPGLVLAVAAVESGLRPEAVSPKGAQGLMQLMPTTARELGVRNPFDPAANLDGGSRYLKDLIHRYDGDLTKALAAYNAGAGAVERHKGVPPYRETRDYVKKVLQRYKPKEG